MHRVAVRIPTEVYKQTPAVGIVSSKQVSSKLTFLSISLRSIKMKFVPIVIATLAMTLAGAASAEFKVDAKVKADVKKVNQLAVTIGKDSVAQNGVASINSAGIKNANIKFDANVKAGDINQLAVSIGKSSVAQNGLANINLSGK
jgi:hypothetical protein